MGIRILSCLRKRSRKDVVESIEPAGARQRCFEQSSLARRASEGFFRVLANRSVVCFFNAVFLDRHREYMLPNPQPRFQRTSK